MVKKIKLINMRSIFKSKTGHDIHYVGSVAKTLTPSDTAVFEAGYVYIGGDGDLICVPAGNNVGDSVTFTDVKAGTILPILIKQVLVATSASDLILIH